MTMLDLRRGGTFALKGGETNGVLTSIYVEIGLKVRAIRYHWENSLCGTKGLL